MFQTKVVEKHITSSICSLPQKNNCVGYEIMWKDVVELSKQWMAIRCVHCACWMSKAINTLKIWNTYCYSTAAMIARTCLIAVLYVHCFSCLSFVY